VSPRPTHPSTPMPPADPSSPGKLPSGPVGEGFCHPFRALCMALVAVLGLSAPYAIQGQEGSSEPGIAAIRVPRFPLEEFPGTTLSGPVRSGEYLGAVGPRAAWLGFETGQAEVWIHPLKVAREVSLSFKIPQYSQPIPGANVARRVDLRPEAQTITYSHGAFQVREHILAPRDRSGILLLLEVDAVVDLEIHVSFQPVMQYAWPGGIGGQYLYWDAEHRVFVLSESRQLRNAVIGSPWASEASAHPAHRLAEAPSTFVIPVNRDRAREEFIPLAVVGGVQARDEVLEAYRHLLEDARSIYDQNLAWARELRNERLAIQVQAAPEGGERDVPVDPGRPEAETATALEWAKINLEEQRACNPDLGCGLVAGWGPSGTSLRPGFGWYFGGDAAINSLALDVTGQWDLVAEGLRFLARYQRADGKIPHEISQAAGTIPWFTEFPYAYYHADTTPYWIVALWQYWRASGDDALVRELWQNVQGAYRWCLSVETDGDGLIENTTGGLGAIEVGGLGEGIHQDIYLAAVWVEALKGTIQMAEHMGDRAMAGEAETLLGQASATLNEAYWRPAEGHLAFGILQDGTTNDNLTAWPGTALSFGLIRGNQAEGTLRSLASDAISASWGARLLSTESDLYDPLHYNNGAVWPFMTGFVSWAQYEYRRPWAGFPLLKALLGLTGDFALGRHPENLSGAYYQTMDATVPHQFFATSMLVTPLVRGLLGWDPNAPEGTASLAPQPPPSWRGLAVTELRVGESRIELEYLKEKERVKVTLAVRGPPVRLSYLQSLPLGARNVRVEGDVGEEDIPVPPGAPHDAVQGRTFLLEEAVPVELVFHWNGGVSVEPPQLPLRLGDRSGGLRILDFTLDEEAWALDLEGDGGQTHILTLFGEAVRTEDGSTLRPDPTTGRMTLLVPFQGDGRVHKTIRLKRIES